MISHLTWQRVTLPCCSLRSATKSGSETKNPGSWCSVCLGQLFLEGRLPAWAAALPSLVPGRVTQLSRGWVCSHMLPALLPAPLPETNTALSCFPKVLVWLAHVPRSSRQGWVPAAPMLSLGKVEAEKPLAIVRTTPLPSPSPVGAALWCPRDIL